MSERGRERREGEGGREERGSEVVRRKGEERRER